MGCLPFVKILLVIFTIIFWAFGVAILGIGIWIKTDPEISNLGQAMKVGTDEPVIEIITWLFIGSGIFVSAVGLVGLIGTIRGSKIMLGFYIVCIFLVFAAEASAGIYAGIRKDYVVQQLEENGRAFIKSGYSETGDFKSITKGFNYVQVTHSCCGVIDFMDYRNSSYLEENRHSIKANATLSYACCNTTTGSDTSEALKGDGRLTVDAEVREICMTESVTATNSYLYPLDASEEVRKENTFGGDGVCAESQTDAVFNCKKGCSEAIGDWVNENLIIFVGVGIAIGACQLILLFLSLWYCQSVNKDDDNGK